MTIRIWLIFTFIIIIIIFLISLLYLYSFRYIDKNNHIKDMKAYHDIILKDDDFNHPPDFTKMRNLINVENFIVNFNHGEKEIQYVNNPTNNSLPMNGSPGAKRIDWISSFAKNIKSETQFRAYYDKVEYLIIISPIKNTDSLKSYFVTYMPYYVDNKFLYEVILIGMIFIIIAFITSKLVATYISKPLKKLENYTREIADKNWVEPIKIDNDEEIGKLARSMNIMQKKLKYADENEKIFLQSISHSLKTTVMVIMSHAQAIIDGVYIDSPERTAEIIKDESIGLEKKIKQILYLNTLEYTLENNLESEKNKSMDLRDVVSDMVDKFKVVSDDIKWELETSSCIIFANEEKIKVCLENILDNALRYAESIIKIRLERNDNFAVMEIYDDGKHIDEDSIKLIFNHMYKDKTGNFGLGLAISKKIIDFYNGTIEAVNREKGVSFIIKHPLLRCNSN